MVCGSYLGLLTKVRIGHDNSGFGPGWFLNKVTSVLLCIYNSSLQYQQYLLTSESDVQTSFCLSLLAVPGVVYGKPNMTKVV